VNAPTSDELEEAIDDIGYVVLQACVAHDLFHIEVIPVLRKNGTPEETISIINNASLEAQLFFLRKLNEFFESLRARKEDDLRAEHYFGFKSPGPILSDEDEAELHKQVGHITLKEVRDRKKDWTELLRGYVPVAMEKSLEFFRFLCDSDQVSGSMREDARYYIEQLDSIKDLLNRRTAAV
jgi:hypothetical protein